MPRQSHHAKEDSFNFRVDPALKSAFQSATEAEDKPAAQVLREFMRSYVARHQHRDLAMAARQQSRRVAARALDPTSDEAAVMQELEANLDEQANKW